ncbi:UDP-N-acetylmuramoyl-L-alanine--D-glutamate ligase [Micromonospora sp. WMMD1102]|uniref:UDP-N-acetylmuramoyl-L-alanine--D-glutamate ligase n=1 Tax=Micromonospora sp. WMMD1102 TaxID=3016105 RepID=UPI00241570B5|nr:UDP-N-acetylmuramoyl-L-alanine--D-glutamate ligase [Micromonospora sp. WMMD1102]MDG4791163.1 UDP-N-acetylmuramoyl-L-alanine--D-glutamate ligase [Micromonospora sp. WMMD1102]
MQLADLRGRRVAVWGTGREGVAAINAIAPVGPAELVAVMDRETYAAKPWTGRLAELAPLHTGPAALAVLLGSDVVVRSPVIGETHPWVVRLRERGIPITSGTALWMAEHAANAIGVTGSKGKSTTTNLISHLLTAVDRPNVMGGNIGVPMLDLPPAPRYVLELSMYQCADLTDSPEVAVLTSLAPEHLDWAGGEAEYYRNKLNLVEHGPRWVVFNAHDDRLRTELAARPGLPLLPAGTAVDPGAAEPASQATTEPASQATTEPVFQVTAEPDGTRWVRLGDRPLFPRDALPLVGRHNEGNLCVALTALRAVGVDCVAERDRLAAALGTLPVLEHRLTPIEDPSGITFVDDSLSTIPQSAIHAIEAYANRPLTVIVGGEDRGVDYGPLRDFLAGQGIVATLIGIPDSGPRILDVVKDLGTITTLAAEDLPEAVRLGRERTPAGGVVLLSPAAPSYGRFDNYAHRSRVFRQAIEETR